MKDTLIILGLFIGGSLLFWFVTWLNAPKKPLYSGPEDFPKLLRKIESDYGKITNVVFCSQSGTNIFVRMQ